MCVIKRIWSFCLKIFFDKNLHNSKKYSSFAFQNSRNMKVVFIGNYLNIVILDKLKRGIPA